MENEKRKERRGRKREEREDKKKIKGEEMRSEWEGEIEIEEKGKK